MNPGRLFAEMTGIGEREYFRWRTQKPATVQALLIARFPGGCADRILQTGKEGNYRSIYLFTQR